MSDNNLFQNSRASSRKPRESAARKIPVPWPHTRGGPHPGWIQAARHGSPVPRCFHAKAVVRPCHDGFMRTTAFSLISPKSIEQLTEQKKPLFLDQLKANKFFEQLKPLHNRAANQPKPKPLLLAWSASEEQLNVTNITLKRDIKT